MPPCPAIDQARRPAQGAPTSACHPRSVAPISTSEQKHLLDSDDERKEQNHQNDGKDAETHRYHNFDGQGMRQRLSAHVALVAHFLAVDAQSGAEARAKFLGLLEERGEAIGLLEIEP